MLRRRMRSGSEGKFRRIIGYPDLAKPAVAAERDIAAREAADTRVTATARTITPPAPQDVEYRPEILRLTRRAPAEPG